jgi:hypothetical protein
MDAPHLPLWWSWLWWPTTLLTGGAGSGLYLYIASLGLNVRRRVAVALGGAGLSVVIGGLFFATASNICADGAHLRVNSWVPLTAALVWFTALLGLGMIGGIRAPYVWVGPLLGLVAGAVALWAEAIIGLHTMSRYCDGLPKPLRLHTTVAVALPALVLGVTAVVGRSRA